jgi:hypothetical protein
MNKLIFAFTAPFIALCATLGAAQAQTAVDGPQPVRLLLGVGVSGGGDKLVSAEYEDGSTVNIHAGGLVYLTAGVDYEIIPGFSLQGTINYHVDSADARNGEIRFERFPIELIGYYQPNPVFRVGGGLRWVSSPKLSGSGKASDLNVNFDKTRSAVVEAEYFVDPTLGIKLRYVNETYKAPGRKDIDGSHVGLSANFYF